MISVIIPVYNSEKYLERTIISLQNQTFHDMEFIFVNDGSTDRSLEILEEKAKEDERIVILSQENKGVSAARNLGLSASKGEFVGFADSDDEQDSSMFECMYNAAIQSDADIVFCGHVEIDKGMKRYYYNLVDEVVDAKQGIKYLIENQKIGMSACTKLFKKNILDGVFFCEDKHINEDRYFVFCALQNAKRIKIISETLYYYYQNADSATHKEFDSKKLDGIYFSEKMLLEIQKKYPDLEKTAYTDVVMQCFYTLTGLYKTNTNNIKMRKYIAEKLKKLHIFRVRKLIKWHVFLQLFLIKINEPLFRCVRMLFD